MSTVCCNPELDYSITPHSKNTTEVTMQGTMKAARIYGFEKTSKYDLLRVERCRFLILKPARC